MGTYDKETVKENLELEDIYNLLEYFNAEPELYTEYIVAKTICHHGDSHKLYYYDNTQLFKCYTGSCGSFDVFELVQKINEIEDLNKAVYFIVNFFNLQSQIDEINEDFSLEDWKIFSKYNKINDIEIANNNKIELPQIDNLIKYYPQPRLLNWEKEGIDYNIIQYANIHYDPVMGRILIPHYDSEDRLIGIRQRTLVQEDEIYGKYRPARLQEKLCNHPLAFNLYGLNWAKDNIQNIKIAIIVESEKSVLEYMSYFGQNNNLCVAVCGSSLSKYQFNLLLEYNIQEIAIAFDKDYENNYTLEYTQFEDKLTKLYNKYGQDITMSFLIDKNNLLSLKDSPLDRGKEVFLQLWKDRVIR